MAQAANYGCERFESQALSLQLVITIAAKFARSAVRSIEKIAVLSPNCFETLSCSYLCTLRLLFSSPVYRMARHFGRSIRVAPGSACGTASTPK